MLFAIGTACEICGDADSQESLCKMCGARVCKNCFVESNGLCSNCEEAKCYLCGDYLASRACNVCGKLVCEDHGTKKDEATICDECRLSDK
jgi:hypothetical protein